MKPIRRLFIDTGMRQSIELFLKEVSFCAMRASCCSYSEVTIYIPKFILGIIPHLHSRSLNVITVSPGWVDNLINTFESKDDPRGAYTRLLLASI